LQRPDARGIASLTAPGVRRRHRLRRPGGTAPAISNWRTTAADLDLPVEIVRELAASATQTK
jgi:hypothetical protein